MKNSAHVKISKDNTEKIERAFKRAMQKAVQDACVKCEERVCDNIKIKGAVDTGALWASVYIALPRKDGFAEAVSRALSLRPDSEWFLKPRRGFGRTYGDKSYTYTGVVAVAAGYGLFVERGTRHTPGRPFLAPAVEETNKEFAELCTKAFNDKMKGIK